MHFTSAFLYHLFKNRTIGHWTLWYSVFGIAVFWNFTGVFGIEYEPFAVYFEGEVKHIVTGCQDYRFTIIFVGAEIRI